MITNPIYPFIAVGDTVELDLSCWGRISFKDKEAEAREVVR